MSQSKRYRQRKLPPLIGYEFHRKVMYSRDGVRLSTPILVPKDVVRKIRQEEADLLRQKAEAEDRRLAADMALEKEAARRAGLARHAHAAPQAPVRPEVSPPQPAEPERKHKVDPTTHHRVFADNAPAKLVLNLKESTADRDIQKRIKEVNETLESLGPFRKVASPKSGARAMDKLEHAQPHFRDVVSLVRNCLVLAARTRKAPRIPPMLLLGEPGLGKTHFAKALAAALGSTMRQFNFDAGFSNSILVGSEKKWANSSMGALFEMVCLGEHANPVVVLDEIDKASRTRQSDALAPLHGLLEPTSAGSVTDLSLDFQFDASLVVWIATANDPTCIPASFRSRFRTYRIEFPTAEESIQIAEAVATTTVEEHAPSRFQRPSRSLAVRLAHLTPREVMQAVMEGIGKAVAAGRSELLLADFSAEALAEDEAMPLGNWLH